MSTQKEMFALDAAARRRVQLREALDAVDAAARDLSEKEASVAEAEQTLKARRAHLERSRAGLAQAQQALALAAAALAAPNGEAPKAPPTDGEQLHHCGVKLRYHDEALRGGRDHWGCADALRRAALAGEGKWAGQAGRCAGCGGVEGLHAGDCALDDRTVPLGDAVVALALPAEVAEAVGAEPPAGTGPDLRGPVAAPGDVVRTSYGTGPYVVEKVARDGSANGRPRWYLTLRDQRPTHKKPGPSYLSQCQRHADGRITCTAGKDEMVVLPAGTDGGPTYSEWLGGHAPAGGPAAAQLQRLWMLGGPAPTRVAGYTPADLADSAERSGEDGDEDRDWLRRLEVLLSDPATIAAYPKTAAALAPLRGEWPEDPAALARLAEAADADALCVEGELLDGLCVYQYLRPGMIRLIRGGLLAPLARQLRQELLARAAPPADAQGVPAVFTTGQIAKLLKVAPRTVSKWFDSGKLKGYRVPGSNDRRVPREQLVRFCRENEVAVPEGLDTTPAAWPESVTRPRPSPEGFEPAAPEMTGTAAGIIQRTAEPSDAGCKTEAPAAADLENAPPAADGIACWLPPDWPGKPPSWMTGEGPLERFAGCLTQLRTLPRWWGRGDDLTARIEQELARSLLRGTLLDDRDRAKIGAISRHREQRREAAPAWGEWAEFDVTLEGATKVRCVYLADFGGFEKRQFMFKGPAEVLSDTGVWVTWAVRDNAAKEGEGVTEYAARVCAACAHDYARKNRGRGRKRAPKTAQEGKA